jgi:hypothetical protein
VKIDVTYDGTAYPFDFATLDLPEMFTVKKIANINGGQFQVEAMEFNPGAILALVVLALRRGGTPAVAKDIDQAKVDVEALTNSFADALGIAREKTTPAVPAE